MPFILDTSITSANQDSRVRSIVIHYTASSLAGAIKDLTDPVTQVSSHYLVPDQPLNGVPFRVFQLVPEERRAWHAGVSYWHGEQLLNSGSIGIELVNLGFPAEDQQLPPMSRRWTPYSAVQVQMMAVLVADIARRHEVLPTRIVGHADIAPGRKWDPGPLFPWEQLYRQYGIGAWPEDEAVSRYATMSPYNGDVSRLQRQLSAYGYETPQNGTLDYATISAVSAFQMHFRPQKYDGAPDVETIARLDALLEKYVVHGTLGA